MRYRIFDSVLESDVPLPELAPSRASRVHIHARLKPAAARRHAGRWQPVHRRTWPEVSRRGDDVRIRFSPRVHFVISDKGTLVHATAPRRYPVETLRHLLIDQVIPMVLSARGRLIVHGSAVQSPWGGVLLLGASGAGKSTLAVALAGAGWKLLSDDYVRVRVRPDGAHAVAAYAGARLWPDVLTGLSQRTGLPRVSHYNAKRRMRRDAFGGQVALAAPLQRIYLLASGKAVSVRPVTQRDTLVTLLSHTLRLDAGVGRAERRRLELLARLCGCVAARQLSYPRDLRHMDRVQAAIADDLAGRPIAPEER